jgi:SAM-dependent methyltransferase
VAAARKSKMAKGVQIVAARAVASLRRDGIATTARKALWHLMPRKSATTLDPFDIVHGTDTGGVIPVWDLDIDSKNARFARTYSPSDPKALTEAVSFAGIIPSATSFVDLGCGKGRILIVAAELGFEHIIGIEFAPTLVTIAERNLQRLHITNAEILCGDASKYKFPDITFVAYLYNPFGPQILTGVIKNLRIARARTKFVIYNHPLFAKLFDRCDFLMRLGSPPGYAGVTVWATRRTPDFS